MDPTIMQSERTLHVLTVPRRLATDAQSLNRARGDLSRAEKTTHSHVSPSRLGNAGMMRHPALLLHQFSPTANSDRLLDRSMQSLQQPPSESRTFAFAHRLNPDESYDSICMFCFLTAANAPSEDQLLEPERLHASQCWEEHSRPSRAQRRAA